MIGVRFREGEGYQGKCELCLDWWPIDGDYWDPNRGFRRCRACHIEAQAKVKRLQRKDPAYRAKEADYYVEWRGTNLERARKTHADRQRARYHNDPIFRERRLAASRAYANANREHVRAVNRAWYRRQRENAA